MSRDGREVQEKEGSWILDEHLDVVKFRDAGWLKKNEWWMKNRVVNSFSTEAGALAQMVNRAKVKLENAEQEVRRAKRRLQKCERKFWTLSPPQARRGV